MAEPARWSAATDEGAAVPEHIERWYWLAQAAAVAGPQPTPLRTGIRS
jgi:hypothetical protein